MSSLILPGPRRGVRDRLARLHWPLIILLTMLAGAGVITLYSVAEGNWQPWAFRHAVRYVAALGILIVIGMIAIRYWMALSYPIYFVALIALIATPFIGEINMGARRWIELGGMQFQPSEAMKLGLVMALARYYHGLRAEQVSHILYLIPPALMIGDALDHLGVSGGRGRQVEAGPRPALGQLLGVGRFAGAGAAEDQGDGRQFRSGHSLRAGLELARVAAAAAVCCRAAGLSISTGQ